MEKGSPLLEFDLSAEQKRHLLEEIKSFFEEERGEEIGIIASENVLEFFLNTLGKHIYNKALDDILAWYEANMENMKSDFYARYKY